MNNVMELVDAHMLPHWPFFSWMLIAMLVGQVMKNTMWTRKNAIEKKPRWFWWWMRKTMVLHPVAGGMVLGVAWQSPEQGVDTVVASMGYFAASGGLSTWSYELLRGLAKKKNIDLKIPGITASSPPSGG